MNKNTIVTVMVCSCSHADCCLVSRGERLAIAHPDSIPVARFCPSTGNRVNWQLERQTEE